MITAMNVTPPRRVRRPMRWLALFLAATAVGAPLFSSAAWAQQEEERPANLLRNARFQDDWITLLPQAKTQHWNFTSEYQNRRDYNPDGWSARGSWRWENPDAPAGARQFILAAPSATLAQRINLTLIHDESKPSALGESGDFPGFSEVRSRDPLHVVRDFVLRLRLRGKDVPAEGVTASLSFFNHTNPTLADPLGTEPGAATFTVKSALPAGTYDWKWVEVRLKSSDWLDALAASIEKNAKLVDDYKKHGVPLPATLGVNIAFSGDKGEVELAEAQLLDAATSPKHFPNPPLEKGTPGAPPDADELAPNLLFNGNFEAGNSEFDDPNAPNTGPRPPAMDEPMPLGWTRATRNVYIPPRPYYGFTTWHNRGYENAGFARLDPLVVHDGAASLQIVVPPGDETAVYSNPIVLNQKEARLIEVNAWVKTDRLNMFDVQAFDQDGQKLDGFIFFNKSAHSVGTEDWRLVRQIFRPKKPVKSIRLALEARGVNGYTLLDTGSQPQANVVGTIWWDDVTAREVESASDELEARKVKAMPVATDKTANLPRPWGRRSDLALMDVDFGDRLLGENVFRATLINPSRRDVEAEITLDLSPGKSAPKPEKRVVPARGKIELAIPYTILKPGQPYSTFGKGVSVTFKDGESGKNRTLTTKLPAATWTTPIMVRLGATYLAPERAAQFVRLNLGLAGETMKRVATVRLELIRRATGEVLKTVKLDAKPADLAAQRERIPTGLQDDFANLLLADIDIADLPIQPFDKPERAWFIRATALDSSGVPVLDGAASGDSDPFCRLAHQDVQQPISKVEVKDRLLRVNGSPWIPFTASGGAQATFAGPLANAKSFRDLHQLGGWSVVEGHAASSLTRQDTDLNAVRATPQASPGVLNGAHPQLESAWNDDNRYTSIYWLGSNPGLISVDQLNTLAGSEASASNALDTIRKSPFAVTVNPGVDEVYSHFIAFKPEALTSLRDLTDHLRKKTARPVSVGLGAAFHRADIERVPFFDVYELGGAPFGPAPLHVEFWPALGKHDAVPWVRSEIFESVPYERLRYHTYVELMRGARGWEFFHGTGDTSLLRGLHAEVESLKPVLASKDPGAKVSITPAIESWSKGHDGKTYVIAATTRAMSIGAWRWADEAGSLGVTWTPAEASEKSTDLNARAAGRPRVTQAPIDDQGTPTSGPLNISGIDNLPAARTWPAGTKLVQWVKLEPRATGAAGNLPRNIVIIPKADSRITQAASWGAFDPAPFTAHSSYAFSVLRVLYRNAAGLVGWDVRRAPLGFPYLPSTASTTRLGELPAAGQWVKLEVPLEKIGADKKLIDGCVFMHEGGRVLWGKTALIAPDGTEQILWGNSLLPAPSELRQTRINVAGLKAGAKVKALFEDRTLEASDGYFTDDFTGVDLYQRFGGPSAHGNLPVSLHIYEVPAK